MENIEWRILEYSEDNRNLLLECYKLLNDSFDPPLDSYVDIKPYVDKLIKNAHISLLYLANSNEFVGLYAIYINDINMKVAYLSSFGVRDKFKGLGYAKLLMENMKLVVVKAGLKTIRLEVKTEYIRAVRFYEKAGFKLDNENKTGDKSTSYMYYNL